MLLTIVIQARNEEKCLLVTIRELEQVLKIPHRVIVVDDYSNDRTVDVAKELVVEYSNIEFTKNDLGPGFTNAIKKGFSQIDRGVVVVVMADRCNEPSTIVDMYKKINEGFDIVCGSRYMKGGRREERSFQGFLSWLVGFSLRIIISMPVHDCSNAFKMYKKKLLDSIEIKEVGFASSLEITVKAFIGGYKITEVPTYSKKREAGKSKFQIINAGKNYAYWFFWSIFKCYSKRLGLKTCL